jgi:hypothetical protein
MNIKFRLLCNYDMKASFIPPVCYANSESVSQYNTPKLDKLTNLFEKNTVGTLVYLALYAVA